MCIYTHLQISPILISLIFCYSALMGAIAKLGWQRMDVLVSEHGAEDVLHMVCDQVANGMSLSEVGQAEGIPYSVLWKWLNADGRMEEYEVALEARADKEAHEMLRIADGAIPEEVGVAKLRVDTRDRLIKKWDRNRYGDKVEVTHKAIPVLNIVTAVMALPLEEKVVEGEVLEVADASPIDG